MKQPITREIVAEYDAMKDRQIAEDDAYAASIGYEDIDLFLDIHQFKKDNGYWDHMNKPVTRNLKAAAYCLRAVEWIAPHRPYELIRWKLVDFFRWVFRVK